jgi:hypothetical protein
VVTGNRAEKCLYFEFATEPSRIDVVAVDCGQKIGIGEMCDLMSVDGEYPMGSEPWGEAHCGYIGKRQPIMLIQGTVG